MRIKSFDIFKKRKALKILTTAQRDIDSSALKAPRPFDDYGIAPVLTPEEVDKKAREARYEKVVRAVRNGGATGSVNQ